jgi:hypothetical protein
MLILLAASGCSSGPPPRSELLAQSYDDIQQDYLQPMPARAQALATLRELNAIDSALTVDAVGDELVLNHRAHAAQYFPAPAATDWRGWGRTAADVTAAAAATSPAVGSLSSDVLDAALIRGTLAVLDPYSRYIPPQALSRSLLVEGSDGAESPAAEPPRAVSASAVPRLEPSVRLRLENGIALAQINRFTASTGKMLRRKLASAAATSVGLRGVILDMRDNPGGDISAAVEVARLFLHRGVIVAFEARDPAEREVVSAHHSGDYRTLPLVVLINAASASAAEIVAAALQENDRALVIGSPSFGKGTIQSIFDLANGGELWVTSAYSRAPSGYFLQHHGVLPDICITLPMVTAERNASSDARVREYQYLLATPHPWLSEAQWTEARQLCPPASLSAGDDRALQVAMAIIWNQMTGRPVAGGSTEAAAAGG